MRRKRLFAALMLFLAGGTACAPVKMLNAAAPDGMVLHDVEYQPGPCGHLDVYIPRHAVDAPLVVFFYGGSWQTGNKALYRFVGAALAAHGVVAVIPDYRVYPTTLYPGFLQDAAAATAFAHAHAAQYGADPAHLFLMGHSAGAYNAAMLALDPEWLAPHELVPGRDIAGLIGLAGPYDFLPLTDRKLKIIFGPPAGRAATQPINHVAPGAPPALLAAGDKDQTVDPGNSVRLGRRLTQMNDSATVRIYPGINHMTLIGAISPLLGFIAPVLPDCLAFIRQHDPHFRSAA